jgi:hypothetical protein
MEPQPVTPKDPESEPPPSAALRFLAHRNREHLYVVLNICVLKPFAVKCSATELYPLLKPFVTQKYSREMKTWTYKIITQLLNVPGHQRHKGKACCPLSGTMTPMKGVIKGQNQCVCCVRASQRTGVLCAAWLGYISRGSIFGVDSGDGETQRACGKASQMPRSLKAKVNQFWMCS